MARRLMGSSVATLILVTTLGLGTAACKRSVKLPPVPQGQAVAIFAGGCFWCMEPPFEKLSGVHAVVSGYIGGRTVNPSYAEVSAGRTGHAEAVRIVYDPRKISYAKLLRVFWHNIDPFSANGQFCDRGSQYRPAVFYLNPEQKRLANESRARLAKRFIEPIGVTVVPGEVFYPAEEYHQDYYKKSPRRYYSYRKGCGRDRRLRQIWGAKK